MLSLAILLWASTIVGGTLWMRAQRTHRHISQQLQHIQQQQQTRWLHDKQRPSSSSPAVSLLNSIPGLSSPQLQQRAQAVHLRPLEYLALHLLSLLVPAGIGYVLRGWTGLVLLAIIGEMLWQMGLRWWHKRWMARGAQTLPYFLSSVANAMRAGSSFSQAVAFIAPDLPNPLGPALLRMLRQTTMGTSLSDALHDLEQRLPWQDLHLVALAIRINHDVGGSLATTFDEIVQTLEDRQQMEREIRTLTAQGRVSAFIVTLLPFGIGTMLWFLNPAYMQPLFTTTLGRILLGYALVSIGIGFWIIQKMTHSPQQY
jgi:tight adherence protein B